MSPLEPKRPFEMTDEELFDHYCAASGSENPSANQNWYGAEILRRRFRVEHRTVAATEAAARAAKWASVGAWVAAIAAVVSVVIGLWLHAS
jgi:anti-sigma-K factor RskA